MDKEQIKNCVKAAKHGSADDFGKLYALYAADLYRFALWYLKNETDAEDAVQNACIHAFKGMKSLKNEESFHGWLFRILSNTCKDMLSSKNRLPLLLTEDEAEIVNLADEKQEAMQEKYEIKELLAALPEPDKSIVLLSVIAGFSSKEIGSMLRLNPSTVRSGLSRSLHTLRAQLEK